MNSINPYQNKKNYWSGLSRIVIFVVAFWLIFLLVKALWLNWTLKKDISKLNEQIATLNYEKQNLGILNMYYQTDSFKELEARRKLGLKLSGEQVMIVGEPGESRNFQEAQKQEAQKTAEKTSIESKSNLKLWWEFFIGSD